VRRQLLVALGAVAVSVVASATPMSAQTAPAAPALVPFWLVPPTYPEIARRARVTGVVVVALMVGADGRVESTTIERDIPLLSRAAVEAAKDSGFICRGCTGPMTYRLEYHFRLLDAIEEIEKARAVITSTSGTLPVIASSPIIDHAASGHRSMSGRALEHAKQEP
jgi:TonB family protein